ncbi:MAG: hypothetical protein JJU33_06005 [Phycisphaerales bacterium]|nr:hypothetical protein [Phycisphaerales bacterium]
MKVTILGVHPIEADEPCDLLEVLIEDAPRPIDFGHFVQAVPDRPAANWQTAYDERFLTTDGDAFLDPDKPWSQPDLAACGGRFRVAFFMHYLDSDRPILTPAGSLKLPQRTPLPDRLKIVRYEAQ